MSESITVRFSLHASAKQIYDAWLDSAAHTAMTGSPAKASREVGGVFTAWDNYISGKNLLLLENKKIVQSWRSSEFPEDAADSVLSIKLTERQGITEVELEHRDIPAGQGVQYQSGWIEFYANPMQKYFSAASGTNTIKASKRSVAKKTVKKVAKKKPAKKAAKKAARKTVKKKVLRPAAKKKKSTAKKRGK